MFDEGPAMEAMANPTTAMENSGSLSYLTPIQESLLRKHYSFRFDDDETKLVPTSTSRERKRERDAQIDGDAMEASTSGD
ncbi:hypothetical protein NL676_032465 [Syzygium grande]|nr:hypothetical protein NL676_032465 [Syzygium grande]